ncbi:MAG: hypothetical protein AB7I19_03975 [Planctomycetota bacterium]
MTDSLPTAASIGIGSRLARSIVLALCVIVGGCSLAEFYGQEYVIYDPKAQAAPGSPGQEARDGAIADKLVERSDPVKSAPSANESGVPAVSAEGDVDRVFLLENLLAELDRALREGVGPTDQLHQKRTQIEAELEWRRKEIGPLYQKAREQRIAFLSRFPVVVK